MNTTKNALSMTFLAILVASMLSVSSALAQGDVYAYPKAGQSEKQQKRDRFECHEWAVQETGFNPMSPESPSMPTYQAPPPRASGGFLNLGDGGMFGSDSGMLGDAATGAALGAAGGALAGDAGEGAAIGAIASTLFGEIERSSRKDEERRWRQQQQAEAQRRQQQQAQQRQMQTSNYKRAYSVCMRSRNYAVD